MRRSSTFLKLLAGNLLVVLLVMTVAGWWSYQAIDERYRQQAAEAQDALAAAMTARFQDVSPLDKATVGPICKLLAGGDRRLTVIAADGDVLGDSVAEAGAMSNHRTPSRPEILAALEGRRGQSQRISETVGIPYRYVALPLRRDGQVVGAVRLAAPVRAMADEEAVLRNVLLSSSAAALGLAVLLGLLVSWLWYAPLRRLTRAAGRIAAGDLSRRIYVGRSGELAELARALDEMRRGMSGKLAMIDAQQKSLQTVLANLRDGVVALDADGKVLLMNQAARDLLNVPSEPAGQPLSALVRIAEVVEIERAVRDSSSVIQCHVETDLLGPHRVLALTAAMVDGGQTGIRCLLVVHDVTALASAASMKAHFVANASHELRTPIATIRAAADSLTTAANQAEVASLAAILDRQIRRLEEMTNDLLDLHAVESGKFPLRLGNVVLGELSKWIDAQFADIAMEKGVRLAVEADQAGHVVRSDRKLLELILRNLVDNAIKFTPSGGRVSCRLAAHGDGAVLRVSDTGCGIAPQDQGRVFERFFQVDTARTGDSRRRGTGLGLAIVKHAAERLNARIELTSALGQGTVVAVHLQPPGVTAA
jgi:two-component system phosphate regulon sensor histidine kinase PhoR